MRKSDNIDFEQDLFENSLDAQQYSSWSESQRLDGQLTDAISEMFIKRSRKGTVDNVDIQAPTIKMLAPDLKLIFPKDIYLKNKAVNEPIFSKDMQLPPTSQQIKLLKKHLLKVNSYRDELEDLKARVKEREKEIIYENINYQNFYNRPPSPSQIYRQQLVAHKKTLIRQYEQRIRHLDEFLNLLDVLARGLQPEEIFLLQQCYLMNKDELQNITSLRIEREDGKGFLSEVSLLRLSARTLEALAKEFGNLGLVLL